jgi:Alpha-mannosidase
MDAELGLYKNPWFLFNLASIRKKIYTKVGDLDTFISTDNEPIPFNERFSRSYRKIKKNETWGRAFTCAWFNLKGQIPEVVKNKHIVLIVDIDGEGLYVDGENRPICGISSRLSWVERVQSTKGKTLIDFCKSSEGGENIDIWVEGGFNGKIVLPFGKSRFKAAYIAACRDDIKDFYYDYLTLVYALLAVRDSESKNEIAYALKVSYSALKDYTPENVEKVRDILIRILSKTDASEGLTFTAVGHSHLDLAWLWPIRETRRKAARTFSIALKNIEKYPEYIYGASQPQQFEWVKQDYPSLYERLKEEVKNNRIELQGGMWVECDTNLPSGESLIRQIYYGKKFFNKEFNQDMKICWLPDAFGFSGNLPQILKKTGIDYFMTIKLSWNEYNKFPFKTFNWTGIDGSSIIVHIAPEGTYCSGGTPLSVRAAADNFSEKDELNDALIVYGTGDGGGGPGEAHIELIRRQKSLAGLPKIKLGRAIDFFEKLSLSKDNLKSYRGELYLEKHQGTYTTQARNKYYNRKIEFLLHDVEMLSTLAYLRGCEYPEELLKNIWKEVLLYQFHDLLPGSGIKRIYDESTGRYAEMMEELKAERERIISFLCHEKRMTFINSSPFARDEYVKHEGRWYYGMCKAYSSSEIKLVNNRFDLKYGRDYTENELLKVVFSDKGYIVSLYDKVNNKEYCGEYLNRLTLYKDKWKIFNAWDIDINYYKKKKIILHPEKSETYIDGPKVIRRSYYSHGRTTLTQDVILTSGKQLVEFDTECDYHETFRMLRADFAPSVYSGNVKCDIQFGSIDRSTGNDTSIEKAQFEICAHKWVDLSDDNNGISLINDCKYGHRVKDGLISLNLLRSPVYPDPTADRGKHKFRYALYPHMGDISAGDTVKTAYHFNMDPIVCDNDISFDSMVLSHNKNIVAETIKKAEDGEGVILRLYECSGLETTAEISTSINYLEAFECDMLENVLSKVKLNNLSFIPFEVKTILLKL